MRRFSPHLVRKSAKRYLALCASYAVRSLQHVEVVGDLRGRLGPLDAVAGLERLGCGDRVLAVLGVVDLGQGGLRAGLGGLGQRIENVADLVPLASLLGRLGEHLTHRLPEPQRPVADGEHR